MDDDTKAGRGEPRWSRTDTAVTTLTVVLLLLFTFPLFGIANSAEPILLGMPFSMFWIVFWIAVEFVILLALYFAEFGRGGR